MINETMLRNATVQNILLRSIHGAEAKMDDDSIKYWDPRLNYSGGWKDMDFAIAFWINVAVIILVGSILSIPAIVSSSNHSELKKN